MIKKLTPLWLFFGLVVFSGCESAARLKDSLVGVVVDYVPRSVDKKIGELAQQSNIISAPSKSSTGSEALRRLVLPLVETSKIPELEINFNITDASVPNAFAFPDGSIFFTTQLIQLAETPEELLSVAGHEIAHVHLRHSMQQLVTRAAFSISVQLLFGDMGGIADLIYAGTELANLKFSRDHERQADITGTNLLRAAQLPAKGAYQFFVRMKEYEQKKSLSTGSSQLGSIFSTHPQTDERMAWAAQLPDDDINLITNDMRVTFDKLKAQYR